MGIDRYTEGILTLASRQCEKNYAGEDIGPSILTLGRQNMVDSDTSPEQFFASLGFKTIDSMDVSDFEGCTVTHDLNTEIPDSLVGKYSCVFDGGTTEHVFDVKTSLFNIHNMLRPGGVTVHGLPVNNYINHGFNQFSPALFYGFYEANEYNFLRLDVIAALKGQASTAIFSSNFDTEKSKETLLRLGMSCRIVMPDWVTPQHMISLALVVKKPGFHATPKVPTQPMYSEEYQSDEYEKYKSVVLIK